MSNVQLSSADLKKPLEKETAKLKEMTEKLQGQAPGEITHPLSAPTLHLALPNNRIRKNMICVSVLLIGPVMRPRRMQAN